MENNIMIRNENICRLCLKGNIRMCFIKNTYLQDVYEKITNVELSSSYIQSLCYLCVKRLKHCHKLIQQAITTDKLLKDALQCGVEISNIECTQIFKLSVSSTINISLDPVEFEIKEENGRIKEELKDNKEDGSKDADNISSQNGEDQDIQNIEIELKETCSLDDVKSDFDVKDAISDSEDEVPLKSISLKQRLERKLDNAVKIKKFKKFNKDTKVDAQELILDDEQQMIEMLQRSKSLNYLNSPYKCDLCYKGFLDPTAFEKHKEKHDEISGPHECKLCHLRYLTVKSLRAHSVSAHSRRYACNICSHRSHTNKPTSYLSHVRKWHSSASEHVCRECGEGFARKHGLLMHVSKSHRRDNKSKEEPTSEGFCVECNIQFSSSEAKTRHVLISKRHVIFKDNDSKCSLCGAKVPVAGRAGDIWPV